MHGRARSVVFSLILGVVVGVGGAAAAAVLAAVLVPQPLLAQASEIPSAAPPPVSSQDQDKRGRQLLQQMVEALGGEAWLHRTTMMREGHTASFFRGAPTLNVVDFWDYTRFADAAQPEAERIEFTKKHDVVQIWTPSNGYEITYKGNKPLPEEQVQDYLRRRSHSVEAIIQSWLKQPEIVVLYEGTTMVERRMAEKVTLLGADNDAVTLELDANTHLPLRRSFRTRNTTFKDYDEDEEQYEDYHLIQGIQTPLSVSRYHNGDLANQRFFTKVEYDVPVTAEMFDTERPLKGKKK
jgi:hypothetical protein